MKRLVLAVALLAAACSKNIQNSDAVRSAILEYLNAKSAQTGLNMANMTVDITALEFERDSARASVSFRVKDPPTNTGMSLNYTLDRKGDKWVVRERAESSGNPHGGAVPNTVPSGAGGAPGTAMPPGHPATGGAPGGAMPPGHPAVGSAPGGAMPPGHPGTPAGTAGSPK